MIHNTATPVVIWSVEGDREVQRGSVEVRHSETIEVPFGTTVDDDPCTVIELVARDPSGVEVARIPPPACLDHFIELSLYLTGP